MRVFTCHACQSRCICAAARFRDEIGGVYALIETVALDEDDGFLVTNAEVAWEDFPDYEALKKQAFAPERPGRGKYGDPRDQATWRHYVIERHAHAYHPELTVVEHAIAAADSVADAVLLDAGSFAPDQSRVRVFAYAHSFLHWRDKLYSQCAEMTDDGHLPTTFDIKFAPGVYGPSSIGVSPEESTGRLIVPQSKLELFERTYSGVILRPAAPGCLRFPIFQPSSGRAKTVRQAHKLDML